MLDLCTEQNYKEFLKCVDGVIPTTSTQVYDDCFNTSDEHVYEESSEYIPKPSDVGENISTSELRSLITKEKEDENELNLVINPEF